MSYGVDCFVWSIMPKIPPRHEPRVVHFHSFSDQKPNLFPKKAYNLNPKAKHFETLRWKCWTCYWCIMNVVGPILVEFWFITNLSFRFNRSKLSLSSIFPWKGNEKLRVRWEADRIFLPLVAAFPNLAYFSYFLYVLKFTTTGRMLNKQVGSELSNSCQKAFTFSSPSH